MRRLVYMLIWMYKSIVSPYLGNACRFEPTCSSYAHAAFHAFPIWKATALTIWRILRCNPFSKGGYDPIPLTKRK